MLPSRMHFTDVPASEPLCRYSNYLWARNVTDECDPNDLHHFCPDDYTTRGQLARYLVKGFRLDLYKADIKREFLCPYSGNLSWGDYSLIMDTGLTDAGIDRAVNLASAIGIGRGLRTMINIIFQDYKAGDHLTVQPYKTVLYQGEYKFDLSQYNQVFWNRVDRLVKSMNVAGFKKKPVFTISNQWGCTYQGGQNWKSPWCHNINNRDFQGDWMSHWTTLNPEGQQWIINEYKRLAQKFLQHGVDTIELYNESNLHKKDGSLDLETIQAHKDIISALKTIPNLKIQVNFSLNKPACIDADIEKCENEIIYPNTTQGSTRIGFDDSDFSKIWNDFTKDNSDWKVDYFSVHSIKPSHLYWLTPELLNRKNRDNEMILELSTDGQHACSPATGRSHHLEAEIIKKLMDYTAAYPGLNFEYDFDLESIQSVEKIKNVCYRDDSKVMVDIKANCRDDGPVCIEPNDPLDNTICHNVIVWTSINADNCIITPKDSANSHWNDGPRGAGWENLKTTNPNNDDRTYKLDCWKGPLNNQTLHYYDYVRVYCKAKCS